MNNNYRQTIYKSIFMSSVSIYLNFAKETEEAFLFYETVFGTKISEINRFGEMPPQEGAPAIPDEVKNLVMHASMPIVGGHVLMSSDAPESFGFELNKGNNMHIMLNTESREETKRIFDVLKQGGVVGQELQDTFWGAYYGSLTDKFGIQWMFNCIEKK